MVGGRGSIYQIRSCRNRVELGGDIREDTGHQKGCEREVVSKKDLLAGAVQWRVGMAILPATSTPRVFKRVPAG